MKKNIKSYNFPEPVANAELVGHTGVQHAFLDAFSRRDEHPMHPVWMLTGVRGIGKATLAYRIARFVFNEQLTMNNEQCYDDATGDLFGNETVQTPLLSASRSSTSLTMPAEHPIFQKMLAGGFGDFFIIDLAHNLDKDGRPKTDTKQISVHTVRAMIERMQLSSMEGAWRIVVVDSLDEMTTAAQNAMLKLLEEPPANTLFLLVAHSLAATLPTVRSRSRVEKLRPLTISELREIAQVLLPPDEQDLSPELLKLAAGSFGRIANLKQSGGDELYKELLDIIANERSSAADVMTIAASIARADNLMGILSDAAARFGCADLYPAVAFDIAAANGLHLEPEIAAFRIIMEIRKKVVSVSG